MFLKSPIPDPHNIEEGTIEEMLGDRAMNQCCINKSPNHYIYSGLGHNSFQLYFLSYWAYGMQMFKLHRNKTTDCGLNMYSRKFLEGAAAL